MTGTNLDYVPVVVGVGVNQYGLRMGLLKHFLQVREQQRVIEGISSRGLRKKARVWFGNAYDLNLRIVEILAEESVNVPMHQSHNAYAKWRM
jgi:predicted glycosyl hydrolase (DUF1957 family)